MACSSASKDLRPNAGSEKCWVWTAQDYAVEELATEQFALKFGTPELAQAFKKAFEEAKEANRKAIDVSASAAMDKSSTHSPAKTVETAKTSRQETDFLR